ncbi:uncharacterized protein [Diadema setosum]|uniref:uncharacterized protein n=1 Tax=Diadema setosum TaxID=31175 RepID=UPI003B3AC18A
MGSFVGGMCMPMLTAKIYQTWGLRTSILLFGGLLLHFVPIGLIFKTPAPKRTHGTKQMTDSRKHETIECDNADKVEFLETAPCLQDAESKDAPVEVERTPSAALQENRTVSPYNVLLRIFGFISQALDVPALREERLVSALLLPSKFLADITYVGWYMYQVSLALSAGVDPNLASFLPVVTGLGGIVMRSLCTATLLCLPNSGLTLMAACEVIAICGLVLYPLGYYYYQLMMLSFVVGFGIAGTFPAFYAVLSRVISEKNFPAMMTYSLCSCGLGGLTGGLLLGKIVDVTGSFAVVFWVEAGMLGASLMLLLCFGFVRWRKRKIDDELRSAVNL